MLEDVKHKGFALAILAAAQFMVVLDATIVNVALPSIQHALHFRTEADLQWVVTAYALTFGGFLLLGGRLADLYGRRKVFLAGIVLFALASLLGGMSRSPSEIIIFRGIQGLGGAMLSPAALSLVLTIFHEGPDRNHAMGVWSMVAAGGGAIGLLLGGFLTQYVDWRWIFFINVPVAIITFGAALRYVPKSLPDSKARPDILGGVSITGSLVALVYALAKAAENGWSSRQTLVSFGISALLMAVFIVNELRVRNPLIRLGIFRRRNVTGGTLVQLLMPAAMFGMFFYMSILMQQILGYSPTKTGLVNLPFTLTIMLVAGVLSRRIANLSANAPKVILVGAPLLAAAGLFFFAHIPVHADYWTDIFPGIIVMGAGMAMVFVTAVIAATQGIARQESGLVSGLLNTGQQIGGAIGLAVLTVISTSATRGRLTYATPGYLESANRALVYGFHRGFAAAAFFALGASLVALVVFKVHRPSTAGQSEAENQPENQAEALPAIPGA